MFNIGDIVRITKIAVTRETAPLYGEPDIFKTGDLAEIIDIDDIVPPTLYIVKLHNPLLDDKDDEEWFLADQIELAFSK